MKKYLSLLLICLTLSTAPVINTHAQIPVMEIIKAAVVKVIKAFDLMIQRLQNKSIALQNAQRVLENTLSKLKLAEIADWTEKSRELYRKYFDELWKVRSTLATYQRVSLIIQRQKQLIEQYQFTWQVVNQDKHFTAQEINYMYRVYTGIIDQSLQNIDQILVVINSYKTQMSDAKRLEIINRAGDQIDKNYNDLLMFNNQNVQLSLNRSKDAADLAAVKKLYGIQ